MEELKYAGFISQHENVSISMLGSFFFKAHYMEPEEKEILLRYLSRGVIVFGFMHYDRDPFGGDMIGPNGYYTDGVWVWPGYYAWYVNRHPRCYYDPEFKKHILSSGDLSVTTEFEVDKERLRWIKEESFRVLFGEGQ